MNKVETEFHDSYKDEFTFYNVKTEETRKDFLINVSLYDDRIVRDEKQYYILHMLTKGGQ